MRVRSRVCLPPTEEDPHAILGVAASASPEEIRIAYHRLVREHHPDALISQGLPPEILARATARIARINAAHDRLVKEVASRVGAGSSSASACRRITIAAAM